MSVCLVRGSINIDEFFHVEQIVLPGQTISSTGFERRGGGKGANQAVAVARAGGPVHLVGAVGLDGAWLVKDLESMGVGVEGVQTIEKEPTGRAIIQLTESGENCIILHKGANFARSDTRDELERYLSEASHLLVQNEIPLATTITCLEYAGKNGINVVYNPSPMPSESELREIPWQSVTYLLVNEGEAQSLVNFLNAGITTSAPDDARPLVTPAGLPSDSDTQIVEAACTALGPLRAIPAFAQTTIVCTLGAAGVLTWLTGGKRLLYLPAVQLQGSVRDTTGAGDCFTGYFVAGLMMRAHRGLGPLGGHDVAELVRFCSQAAGMCVEKRGAVESIPLRADVQARFDELPVLLTEGFDQ